MALQFPSPYSSLNLQIWCREDVRQPTLTPALITATARQKEDGIRQQSTWLAGECAEQFLGSNQNRSSNDS